MTGAGLRPGEVGALRWADIDFQRNIIAVNFSGKTNGARRGWGRLGVTKTRETREVRIGASLLSALRVEKTRQEALYRRLAGLTDDVATVRELVEPDYCIFAAGIGIEDGRRAPRKLSTLRTRFKKTVKAAGLWADIVPHELRHTSITAMPSGSGDVPGVSIADAANVAGHKNPMMAAKTYAHAIEASLVRGADLADALVVTKSDSASDAIKPLDTMSRKNKNLRRA